MSGSSCSHKPLSCSSPPWPGEGRWPLIVGERHQKAAANERGAVVLSANRRRAGRHHPEKLQPTLYNYLLAVIGCQQSFYSREVFQACEKNYNNSFVTNLIFRGELGGLKYNNRFVCTLSCIATWFMSSKSFHPHQCSIDLSQNIYIGPTMFQFGQSTNFAHRSSYAIHVLEKRSHKRKRIHGVQNQQNKLKSL